MCRMHKKGGERLARQKYEQWLTPEGLTLIQGWARDGLTLTQIAHNMGIIPATLSHWQADHKQIAQALRKGQEVCYYETENALFKAATGYEAKEIEEVQNYNADGELISRSRRVRTRHVPPQLGAICFILKNKNPDAWRDKPERTSIDEVNDDGFLEALSGSACNDWQDDENVATESGDIEDAE